jgi:uroporphyrinogen-III synthase
MRLILTRPSRDNEALAETLERHGHVAIRAPLIEIVDRPFPEVPSHSYRAIALSSANAARAFAGHACIARLADIPAFAVGEQSAAAARQVGFRQVTAAGGSAAALAEHLIDRLKPAGGPILYLCGAEVAGDVAGSLERAGFSVTRVILYDALAARKLPEEAEDAMRGGADGVLLYSPRTATIWRSLIEAAGLAPGPLVHYCLSANVAAALAPSYKVEVAARPTQASLLALLGIAGDGDT